MPEARDETTVPAPPPSPKSWRVPAAVTFPAMLLGLLVAGLWPTLVPAPERVPLPDDPDVRAAAALVAGRLVLPASGLRFSSSLAGDSPLGDAPSDQLARATVAARLLDRARRRHGDAGIDAALATLDLASHRYDHAARRFRRVVGRSRADAEARLGLGLALALRARATADPVEERRLELQALAQFAAVHRSSDLHPIALYDRAVMLERVGRVDEARRRAREYLAGDSASAWASEMRRIAG